MTSPKISIVHGVVAGGGSNTCSISEELTTNNVAGTGDPMMYTDCGGRAFWTLPDGTTSQMGGNSTGYLIQQGAYHCENYFMSVPGPPYTGTCLTLQSNKFYTISGKVTVGTWGATNSSVMSSIAPYGTPQQQFIYPFLMSLTDDTSNNPDGFSAITLTQFMTGKQAGGVAAHVWYDELIVSTSPIADPSTLPLGAQVVPPPGPPSAPLLAKGIVQ